LQREFGITPGRDGQERMIKEGLRNSLAASVNQNKIKIK
jgi:hypothetical protein